MRLYTAGSALIDFVRGDITQQDTDAIANAANSGLLGGGGVDGAIHRAAGPELLLACRALKKTLVDTGGRLPTGQAVITPGFKLKAKHVIHCVGPVYADAGAASAALLASCYRNALRLCSEQKLKSVAFPSIATGVYGYPVAEAAKVAVREVRTTLDQRPGMSLVRFVLFDDQTLQVYRAAADVLLKQQ